jgi:hypothetical protein
MCGRISKISLEVPIHENEEVQLDILVFACERTKTYVESVGLHIGKEVSS